MAKLLIVDTCSTRCVVVLSIGDQFSERVSDKANSHAATLLSMVTDLLTECAVSLDELDALAVVNGPGSFTGIRIGLSVVQGLAFAIDRPVILMSSLELLAMTVDINKVEKNILVVLNSMRDEVYFAHYQKSSNASLRLVGTEQVAEISKMYLPDSNTGNQQWVGVGDGWRYKEQICAVLDINPESIYIETNARASTLCTLAKLKFTKGQFVNVQDATPCYLKEELNYRESNHH